MYLYILCNNYNLTVITRTIGKSPNTIMNHLIGSDRWIGCEGYFLKLIEKVIICCKKTMVNMQSLLHE